jgi:hypothetical protein
MRPGKIILVSDLTLTRARANGIRETYGNHICMLRSDTVSARFHSSHSHHSTVMGKEEKKRRKKKNSNYFLIEKAVSFSKRR